MLNSRSFIDHYSIRGTNDRWISKNQSRSQPVEQVRTVYSILVSLMTQKEEQARTLPQSCH